MPTRKPPRPRSSESRDPQPWRGKRIGIYPRLSDDPEETKEGIERQTTDSIRLTVSLGSTDHVLYVETDTSAWKRKRVHAIHPVTGLPTTMLRVIRPVWSQMMEDLRTSVIDGAAVYDIDRLVRDMRDLEDIIDLVQDTGRQVRSCAGTLDLRTEDGIAMARMAVTFANKSSAATSRRVERAHRGRADAGRPVVRGGDQRAFGYSKDGLEILEEEAELLRDAIRRIVGGGVRISDIVNEWSEAGVVSTGGRPFTWNHLWQVLTNPRICGYRSTIAYGDPATGERSCYYVIHTNEDGDEVEGTWPGIISRETWDELQVAIGGGAVKRTTRSGKAGQLLVGVAKCGVCGARIYAQTWHPARSTEPSHRYYCPPKSKGGRGCVTVDGPAADADIAMRYLAAFELGRVSYRETAATPELEKIDQELAELRADRDAERITVPTWARAHDILMEKRKQLAAAESVRTITDPAAAKRKIAEWEKGSLELRRRLIQSWAPRGVLIMPAARRGPGSYSPDRLLVIDDDK